MFGETGSRRPVALASHVGAPVTCSHCKKRQIEDGRERLKLENVFTGCQTRVNDELQFCFFPPFLLLGGVRQQTASLTYDLSTFPCGPSGSVWRADKFIIPIRLRFSKSISRQIRTAHYYRSWNFHLLKVIKLIEHVSAGRCARWYGWKVNGRMRNYSNTRWPSKCKWVIFISSNYMWEVKENGIESRERVCISSDRTSESVRVSSLFFLSNFLSLLLISLIVFFLSSPIRDISTLRLSTFSSQRKENSTASTISLNLFFRKLFSSSPLSNLIVGHSPLLSMTVVFMIVEYTYGSKLVFGLPPNATRSYNKKKIKNN